ncbi:phage tail protein, partial [Candidatus Regiella insecticola]
MTQKGDTRLSEASAPAGTKLQLTHIVLGDNRTPIADLKQTSQIRNEIYRATLDRATVDTTKKPSSASCSCLRTKRTWRF